METTRDQVLRLVRGQKEASVAQVASALGLSHQAVRRHLDGLRADGMVDANLVRHGVGRPSLVFFATEKGEEHAASTYLQLLGRLFRHFDKVEADDSARRTLDSVFSGIAEEVAAEHLAEVRGETLDERVVQVSQALSAEGIADDWRKEDDSFHILNNQCPYLRLAEMSDAPCHSDRRSIELLLGQPVQQTSRIVEGAHVCEYVILPEGEEEGAETSAIKESG